MRRTLTVVLLTFFLTLPLCAQRGGGHGGGSMGGRGGSVGSRSGGSSFGSHGGMGFRGGGAGFGRGAGRPFRGGGVTFGAGRGFRGGFRFRGNRGFRGFGDRRSFRNSRRFFYPYSYVYPYFYYPWYPLSFYDDFDYGYAPSEPAYDYGYGSGGDYYPPDYGLNEQMRQQGLGIYAQPRAATPAPSQPPAAVVQQPERAMPPTVLIYLDGRRVEVRNYAIVGQTLWTFTERAANKVPLSDLNLDATRKANEERGVEFIVPQ